MTGSQQRRLLIGVAATVGLVLGSTVLSGATVARELDFRCALAELDLDASLEAQAALVPQLATLSEIDIQLEKELTAIREATDVQQKWAAVGQLNERMVSSLGELAPGPSNAQHQEWAFQISHGWNGISADRGLLEEAEAQRAQANTRPDVRLARALGF